MTHSGKVMSGGMGCLDAQFGALSAVIMAYVLVSNFRVIDVRDSKYGIAIARTSTSLQGATLCAKMDPNFRKRNYMRYWTIALKTTRRGRGVGGLACAFRALPNTGTFPVLGAFARAARATHAAQCFNCRILML